MDKYDDSEENFIDVGIDYGGTHRSVHPDDIRSYCENLYKQIHELKNEKYELKKRIQELENEKEFNPELNTSRVSPVILITNGSYNRR